MKLKFFLFAISLLSIVPLSQINAAATQYGIDMGEIIRNGENARSERAYQRRSEAESQELEAERDALREQTKFLEEQRENSQRKNESHRALNSDLTDSDMIRLMAGSHYGADIASYYEKHPLEAQTVSRMSLLDAARAIIRVEAGFIKTKRRS
ncbi:MAG: hypothetical protein NT163_06855 [Chlorobiales bacterium]|nr:hypothetical protein [Chlorobiales bacterium]